MTRDFETIEPLLQPARSGVLTNQQILLGPRHDPLEIMTLYSADEWEAFIREWAESLRSQYQEVRRASGAGDKGRDIIGYTGAVNSGLHWDNYQCKRYDHGLYPSDIWPEIAKLCYYTFEAKYTVPRAYYFVAPRGVGPETLRLLEHPDELRRGLISKWSESDTLLTIANHGVALVGELRTYVEAFNFSVFKDLPPSVVIESHRNTRYHAARFGGGLVRLPPRTADLPETIAPIEVRFVQQLIAAYADHLALPLTDVADLAPHLTLKRHFDRQRTHFYLAELLRNFTRDNIPEDGCFERLQETIYEGVIDVSESAHPDGLARLRATTQAALALQVDGHPLKECLEGYHRSGVCHQLANDDRLRWVP